MKRFARCALILTSMLSLGAQAAEPASCRTIRFADIGWTDIAATTALASTVMQGLGYTPTATIASVPIAFAGIKSKQLDAFLGYWTPSMTPVIEPFVKSNSVKVLERPNLVGAKYTLAVPSYVYEAGLKTFADIAKFKDRLEGKIYAIEPGNDGNALIQGMIAKNQFDLKDFKMVESSEAGMLIEVNRAVKQKKWIAFLGWAPHPMNVQYEISYLSGGDDVFGPNYGEAKVYTVTSLDLPTRCPNAAKLVSNLEFTVSMENNVMLPIMQKIESNAAAKKWLKGNPGVLDKWLAGVQTFDGKPGLPEVKKFLGL